MVKLKQGYHYKIGVDEIEGLETAMTEVLKPVLEFINDRVYWGKISIEPTEYRSRDGFIPYSSNCGGSEIDLVVPKCESHDFRFLEFGECDTCQELQDKNELNSHGEIAQCGYDGQECCSESEGHLDAKFRVWLKFEGLKDGIMSFYLYCGGGNGDAPYFRTSGEQTIFESEFSVKSLAELKRKGKIEVNKLLKKLK